MRQLVLLLLVITNLCNSFAQNYPPEWRMYTSEGYLYSIASEENEKNMSKTRFEEHLLNTARTNLAKQIEVRIQNYAQINKQAVNGRTSIHYSSNASFSTDVNVKLLRTLYTYNPTTKQGHAIAYVEKRVARDYYEKELLNVLSKSDNVIEEANNLIKNGFKNKAKNVLEQNLYLFKSVEEPLYWLNIYEIPETEYSDWHTQFSRREQTFKSMITELQHGTIVYLSCSAQLNGNRYTKIANELKADLAKMNCSFTTNPMEADFVITIDCSNRNGNNPVVGGVKTYFSYIDAAISITKTATDQCIYEDEISVKGGHTLGYAEAARVAYKNVKKELSPILIENIKQ